MQFEATNTNGVQLYSSWHAPGSNTARRNSYHGGGAWGVFSRRCGLAVADQSSESKGGVDTIGALRARAAVVPPSSSGKMVSN